MRILEDFYYGDIFPYKKEFSRDKTYAKNIKILDEAEKNLEHYLKGMPNSEKPLEWLSQIIKAQIVTVDIECSERFIEGFTLGLRFTAEAFLDKKPRRSHNIDA